MIEVSQVLECKQLRSQGASVRAISRQLGISRNTVRRYLRGEGSPGAYQMQSPRPRPVCDAIAERVRELLVAERREEAERLAAELSRDNARRQREEERVLRDALRRVRDHGPAGVPGAIVLADRDWHPGVLGIVASKIAVST